jgi:hypothetical protein
VRLDFGGWRPDGRSSARWRPELDPVWSTRRRWHPPNPEVIQSRNRVTATAFVHTGLLSAYRSHVVVSEWVRQAFLHRARATYNKPLKRNSIQAKIQKSTSPRNGTLRYTLVGGFRFVTFLWRRTSHRFAFDWVIFGPLLVPRKGNSIRVAPRPTQQTPT